MTDGFSRSTVELRLQKKPETGQMAGSNRQLRGDSR